MARSKLGLHINFITEADAMRRWILRVRPAVVKTLHHDIAFWEPIKAEYPELFLIGRIEYEHQPLADPIAEARRVSRDILEQPTLRVCDAWEGYNEIARDQLEQCCTFDIALAGLLHQQQARYICGSWSVGVPDVEDWQRPIMLDAIRASDFIGVHAYSAPRLSDPDRIKWYLLRHRLWYPHLPPDCQKPLLLTEFGIDRGVIDVGVRDGWRRYTDADGYVEQLKWADARLQEDEYVMGATIFCWGTLDPDWKGYDISGRAVSLLGDYIALGGGAETEGGGLGQPVSFNGAEQPFERGRMIWRGDTRQVIVFHEDGTWASYEDTFVSGVDPISTDAAPPSGGVQEPAFGFGKVWREQPGVRDRLGWALTEERGF